MSTFKNPNWHLRKYACDVCDKRFKRKSTHRRHRERQYKCLHCQYITCLKHDLDSHFINHHPHTAYAKNTAKEDTDDESGAQQQPILMQRKTMIECLLCEFKTFLRNDLKKHVLHRHPDVIFPCSYCHFTGYTKTDLMNHESAKHFQNRKFDPETGYYI